MKIPHLQRLHVIFLTVFAATAFLFPRLGLCGETSTVKPVVDSYKKQEKVLSEKRFKQKEWSKGQPSGLTDKTLSFEHWNKHYSSLGSKKLNYESEKISDKKRYKTDTAMSDFFKKNKDIELSEWQDHLANLETRARISTDTTAQIIQDKRIYEMMLQQAENYKETGKQLSLRDINRFQFRKNRSKDEVPTTKVGSGYEVD